VSRLTLAINVLVVGLMNWKLFFTLVVAAVASFLVIRWLQKVMDKTSVLLPKPAREIGFAAVMKQTSTC
jgi:hypothetical protein